MFCLKIAEMSQFAYMKAMFILSYYEVNVQAYSNGEEANSTYLVVEEEYTGDSMDAVRMAEMAFQMDFHQVGMKCPHCASDKEDGEQTCGHLTFGTMIDSSAFDKILG